MADPDRRDGRREPKPAVVDVALTSTERDELARLRRENERLRLERDILPRAAAWFARKIGVVPPGRYAFISTNQAAFPVAVMARVFGVSEAGF